jgi:hypothetical protein
LEGVVGEDAVVGFGLEVGVLGEREMGLEVGEGFGDLEAGLGEKGGDFVGHEPAEGLGGAVLLGRCAVDAVAVLAVEDFLAEVDGVAGFEAGAASVGERGLVVGIPAFGWEVAVHFGEGDEEGEVESAAGDEPGVPVAEGGEGIGGELEGEGGGEEGVVGGGGLPIGHVGEVECGCGGEVAGAGAEDFEHVGGEFEAFDFESGLEEWEGEAAGAAADFEGASGVGAEEVGDEGDFGGVVFRGPEVVVEFGFEGEVGLHVDDCGVDGMGRVRAGFGRRCFEDFKDGPPH